MPTRCKADTAPTHPKGWVGLCRCGWICVTVRAKEYEAYRDAVDHTEWNERKADAKVTFPEAPGN